MKRPWGETGIAWIAAVLLVVVLFLALLGVVQIADAKILVVSFALVAVALLL